MLGIQGPIQRVFEKKLFIVLLCGIISACTQAKAPNAINTFASGLSVTTGTVKDSFIAIRETEALRGRARLAAETLCRDSDCPPIEGIGLEQLTVTPEVSTRIFLLLAGLDVYAELLVTLGGGEIEVDPSASNKALGRQLQVSLDAADALTPVAISDFGEDVIIGATKGAKSLGNFLSQESIKENIPDTVEAMHPHIEAVTAYLIEAIGSPVATITADRKKRPPHGLRSTLAHNRGDIGEDSATILNELRKDQKINATELIKLAFQVYDEDIGRVIRTDFALAETQSCLRKMVEAHNTLRNPDDPGTLQKAETFRFYAQRTADIFVWAGSGH